MIFAAFYKALSFASLDTRFAVAYGPRVVQGAFVTIADVYTYKLAALLCGKRVAAYTLGVQVVSWFYFYCTIRTYSNSLETVALVVAMFLWESPQDRKGHALSIAALGVAVRGPSAAICWVYIGLRYLAVDLKDNSDRLRFVLERVLPVAVVSNVLILVVDRIGYGFWTCTLFNFIRWNILEDISSEYGVHPVHWYFTQGLPTTIGTFLPLAGYGAYIALKTRHRARVLVEVVAFFVGVLSMVGHKELRFLLPVLPLVHICCGLALYQISLRVSGWAQRRKILWRLAIAFVGVSNVCAIYYLSRVHQRGSLDVVDNLAHKSGVSSVDFLTRCHATPFHTHIHDSSVKLRFLDCSPGIEALRSDPEKSYTLLNGIEEEDAFRSDRLAFVQALYADHDLPTHIVWEGGDHDQDARGFLERLGYLQVESFEHGLDGSHFDIYQLSND